MSGKPNPNQIGELRQAAALVREQDIEAARLQAVIAESQKKLEAVKESRGRNAEQVVKLLTVMDCASSGNFGWEARIVWLMAELTEQAARAR